MDWQQIETAPKDGSEIILAFKGQFSWVIWVGRIGVYGLVADGHANPTHWGATTGAAKMTINLHELINQPGYGKAEKALRADGKWRLTP